LRALDIELLRAFLRLEVELLDSLRKLESDWLKKAIRDSGSNYTELSQKTGINIDRIKRVRDGYSKFTPAGIKKAAEALGCKPPKYKSTGVAIKCNSSGRSRYQ